MIFTIAFVLLFHAAPAAFDSKIATFSPHEYGHHGHHHIRRIYLDTFRSQVPGPRGGVVIVPAPDVSFTVPVYRWNRHEGSHEYHHERRYYRRR